MPIRPSSGAAIRQLIAALGGPDDVARESAIARLAVIGPRAFEHLFDDYGSASTSRQRAGMLRALETSSDSRGVACAREAIDDPSADVFAAAIALLRAAALSNHPHVAREALEALVTLITDRTKPAAARLVAFDAIKDLPATVVDPVRARLAEDPDPQVAARASAGRAAGRREAADAAWTGAVEGALPASPNALKTMLQAAAPKARLTELQKVIDHIRTREMRETDPAQRAAWRVVRGAAHQALADRGSRLALYDLRDSLGEDDAPLPVSFLAAVEEIGDASCIEPLAAAYDSSSRSGDAWWRDHVASAFRAIVQREGLTRRHLVVKRALTRWPAATSDLMARS